MIKQDDVIKVLDILEETYPDAECALNHKNVYELIVAVALSAQTTDKSVNQVSPALLNAIRMQRHLQPQNRQKLRNT